jgi:hypothetical protein
VSPLTTSFLAAIFLLPTLAVVGAWLWARRLGSRPGVPRFVKWGAFALLVPGSLLMALGLVSGLLRVLGVADDAVEPSQKARRLAEAIAEFMNSSVFGLLLAIAAAAWLGFWAWKSGRKGASGA